jgi:hypothetical protein
MTSVALIFGLNYVDSHVTTLTGCINDATQVHTCLRTLLMYEKVYLHTDDMPVNMTTKDRILQLLKELTMDRTLTRVFIYFAGHGSNIQDKDHDEQDGHDEVIVCSDGLLITDDEICRVLGAFGEGTKVTAVFDCCNSGTICDLVYTMDTQSLQTIRSVGNQSKECVADITVISSCRDNQQALEVRDVNGVSKGVFTSKFLDVIRGCEDPMSLTTYNLASATNMNGMYTQIPVVTSSRPLMASSVFFDHGNSVHESSESPVLPWCDRGISWWVGPLLLVVYISVSMGLFWMYTK